MIDLKLKIQGDFDSLKPFVIQLVESNDSKHDAAKNAAIFSVNDKEVSISSRRGYFKAFLIQDDQLKGDICIVFPQDKSMLRLIRNNSDSNTILLTEQCDQACIMCSQPPKNKIYDYYDLYKEALLLAPQDFIIGISGGEPTLEKDNLFPFLLEILEARPDLKFHILTNAQHFRAEDITTLKKMNASVLWGVPVYSHDPRIHDEIVGKQGAYLQLLEGLNILFKSGAAVEIRTVLLKQNYSDLALLADFIAKHLSSCEIWAIMQLENIGYAKMNWPHIFVDTSKKFSNIANALSISSLNKINVHLYNFPKCTIPIEWREFACKSISDWKNKYLDSCEGCSVKSDCCGFFAWYSQETGFERIRAI